MELCSLYGNHVRLHLPDHQIDDFYTYQYNCKYCWDEEQDSFVDLLEKYLHCDDERLEPLTQVKQEAIDQRVAVISTTDLRWIMHVSDDYSLDVILDMLKAIAIWNYVYCRYYQVTPTIQAWCTDTLIDGVHVDDCLCRNGWAPDLIQILSKRNGHKPSDRIRKLIQLDNQCMAFDDTRRAHARSNLILHHGTCVDIITAH